MSAPSDSSKTLIFYDIAMRQPIETYCCSPNPWKSRYALNFKKMDYTTTWVPLPNIAKVRSGLNMDAVRKFGDGKDFYTLPVLVDPNTDSKIGDSFDIAVYLQTKYPDAGSVDLFPPQNLDFVFNQDSALLVPLSDQRESQYDDYARFNTNVDAAFTSHVGLGAHNLPFDPATAEESKAEFVRRASGFAKSFDDFEMKGEMRQKMKESLRTMLGDLGKLYQRNTDGPFLLGQQASYADFIVGGWLRMMRVTFPENDWEDLRSWHDGIFGKLYDGLEKFMEVK